MLEPVRKRKREDKHQVQHEKSSRFASATSSTIGNSNCERKSRVVTRSKSKHQLEGEGNGSSVPVASSTCTSLRSKNMRSQSQSQQTTTVVADSNHHQEEKGPKYSQNDSSVSTTLNDKRIERLLHCDESPMAAHCHNSKNEREHFNDPQHRRSRRVVAPNAPPPSQPPAKLLSGDQLQDLAESFKFISKKDEETRPDPTYLERHGSKQLPQEYINANMRSICCGWIVELSLEFNFQQETLMLAIRIFDRYLSLSTQPVSRKVLQLVAISSMLLASKMEEVVHPSVKDFSKMSADTFSPTDVKRMEVILLQTLEYRIHSPSIGSYVNIIREATQLRESTYWMSCYLIELCSLHYQFLEFSPSLVACSAVYVARKLCSRNMPLKESRHKGSGNTRRGSSSSSPKEELFGWTKQLECLTGYASSQLQVCAGLVTKLHAQACEQGGVDSPLTPLKDKYRMHSRSCVSNEKPLKSKTRSS